MAAYVIAKFHAHDAEGMKDYNLRVGATIAPYGGAYLSCAATTGWRAVPMHHLYVLGVLV
jgi:uncharacterized protein (DUF1330 family)